jgi:murein DD-endopeptidase MepM/ murein hydrolase activator NlpD
MQNKNWTFLYVPSGEGGVRTVHVDRRLSYFLAGSVGVFLLLVLGMTTQFIIQKSNLHDANQRERELVALRGEIADLESTLHVVEEQMAESFQLQERANLIAGLGPLRHEPASRGLGGQAPYDNPIRGGTDRLSRQRLAQLRLQLERLLQQARAQRSGFVEVVDALRQDQELRDTTPSTRPLRGGWLSSRYGKRVDPFTGNIAFHRGLDFSALEGTPVYATAAGRVKRSSRHGSLGNLVEVDHGNGFVTRYGHLRASAVGKEEQVERGQILGYVGSSGRSTSSHLHYEVARHGRSQNPWLYIIREQG